MTVGSISLNDTLLMALLPSPVVLLGSTLLLAWYWPILGAVIAIGSVLYIIMTVLLTTRYIAPAGRLSNGWDTKMGATLADALTTATRWSNPSGLKRAKTNGWLVLSASGGVGPTEHGFVTTMWGRRSSPCCSACA